MLVMNTPNWELRRISAEDTLPLRQAVLRPGLPLASSQFANDRLPLAGHFGVFVGPLLVSVGSVYPEICDDAQADEAMGKTGAWRLRGMATDPSCRGQGYGAEILKACLEHAKSSGAHLVWAHARTGAEAFYLRHGLKRVGNIYELPGVGPHYLMRIERQEY
jgi:GNAT superfamily N-acetyltransferase